MKSIVTLCLLAITASTALAEPVGVIRGTVRDAWRHENLARAQVIVQFDGETLSAITDGNGAFVFVGVPAKRVMVSVRPAGYAYAPRTLYACVEGGEVTTLPVTVVRGIGAHYWAQTIKPAVKMNATQDEYTLGGC